MSNAVIIGGGVAGIQAAMDLANHGVHAYIIEREPSIGGHMAMLDKTFPTNDCSMCILSPKMAEVSRHPNITILTLAEVEKIEGTAGNFTVTVTKYPRYVNEADCTGCGVCIEVCPVEVYNKFDAGLGVRKAIYKPHAQAVPNLVVRDAVLKRNHCSCVCCMYAMKNAMLIKEYYPECEVSILYNDVRAYGKGYEEYFERAKNMGVTFIRAFAGDVQKSRDSLIIPLENTETGEFVNLEADLVVLSVGMSPEPDTVRLANSLGIKMDESSFLKADDPFSPAVSGVPGIFIAGTALAPKDIPDSVVSGGSAAAKAFLCTVEREE